ncbi:MAG TPA: class I SAM-dependent methyltransferase [Rhodothermales bacterium]|nr:class I SAM-dependent methyltransferase [Rhodothermales bacterium]
MSKIITWLDRKLYPGARIQIADDLFRKEILSLIRPDHIVLDLGAGAGYESYMDFRGKAERVCGVDPDERILTNQFLDEAVVSDGESIPYRDNLFDLVISNNVLEHLTAPVPVISEVARVLKPSGLFLFKTPNKWHYVPLIARVSPHWLHEWVNEKRGRPAENTFPTAYAMNSPKSVRRIAKESGLEVERIALVEGQASYLRFSWPTYLLGCAYERWVNHVPGFDRFRVVMIGCLRKPLAHRLDQGGDR